MAGVRGGHDPGSFGVLCALDGLPDLNTDRCFSLTSPGCIRAGMKAAMLAAFVIGCAGAGAGSGTAESCLVVGVTDGDTVTVRCGAAGAYEQKTLRIAAIDAPEARQPYGQRSKQALSSLCYGHQAGIAVRSTDRYGRSVADVSCQGQDVAAYQVRSGFAHVYDKYACGYAGLYPLQHAAQAQRAGLWADPAPVPPWDYRREKREAR